MRNFDHNLTTIAAKRCVPICIYCIKKFEFLVQYVQYWNILYNAYNLKSDGIQEVSGAITLICNRNIDLL